MPLHKKKLIVGFTPLYLRMNLENTGIDTDLHFDHQHTSHGPALPRNECGVIASQCDIIIVSHC